MERTANEEVRTVCYSYRDREATEEAREKAARDREERRRREERAKTEEKRPAPDKERELVRA